LGRQRTHNEQTLIRPCGVIHARATMYGAEAVSNVLVSSSFNSSPVPHLIMLALCPGCVFRPGSPQAGASGLRHQL
jgi:hypothetical protein